MTTPRRQRRKKRAKANSTPDPDDSGRDDGNDNDDGDDENDGENNDEEPLRITSYPLFEVCLKNVALFWLHVFSRMTTPKPKPKETFGPMWLRDYLPEDTSDARILVFYHNSQWKKHASTMSLRDYGRQLLQALDEKRNSEAVSRVQVPGTVMY
jgi:hypothetical protein